MASSLRKSYSLNEVRYLVEGFERHVERKGVYNGALHALIQLVDLQRSMPRLNRGEREVIVLCGLAGLTVREVAEYLDRSVAVVHGRYMRALEKLTTYMNGDV